MKISNRFDPLKNVFGQGKDSQNDRRTNTKKIIWWLLSDLLVEENHQEVLRALFQVRVGTWVEPLTFRTVAFIHEFECINN